MHDRKSGGFTLVEVVVALAIVAIGMLAVFKTIGETVNNVSTLRDHTFAAWIADNRISEIRISGQMPSVDETAGEVEFAGRRWHWITNVSQTQVAGLRRIDVSVRRDGDAEDTALVKLSGFVGATATEAPAELIDWNWYGDEDPGDGGDGGGEDNGGDNGDDEEDDVGDDGDTGDEE
jgi:general secretion pathway protein I